jgi:hypothetical protein
MRKPRLNVLAIALTGAAFVGLVSPHDARAQRPLRATPFAYIGTVADCGVAGSHIVTAAWLGGMGLPDNGGQNTTALDVATNSNKNDPHNGLLLSKNGPTPDCAAAGATIDGIGRRGITLTELGFDYRNGTHCGAGAPRFNITSTLGYTYFAGCDAGTKTPAPQDPLEWTRVRITTAAQVFPASPTAPLFSFGPGGTEVKDVSIIFDEGTDTPGVEDPRGVGLAVIDNIDVNGQLIQSGTGIADGTNRGRGRNDNEDGDDRHDGGDHGDDD